MTIKFNEGEFDLDNQPVNVSRFLRLAEHFKSIATEIYQGQNSRTIYQRKFDILETNETGSYYKIMGLGEIEIIDDKGTYKIHLHMLDRMEEQHGFKEPEPYDPTKMTCDYDGTDVYL